MMSRADLPIHLRGRAASSVPAKPRQCQEVSRCRPLAQSARVTRDSGRHNGQLGRLTSAVASVHRDEEELSALVKGRRTSFLPPPLPGTSATHIGCDAGARTCVRYFCCCTLLLYPAARLFEFRS